MPRYPFVIAFIVVGVLMLSTGVLMSPAQAAEPSPAVSIATASAASAGIAAGSAEDSHKVCLARIPKDATAGQRVIAEQGCDRDQMDRKGIQAVPGR